MGAIGSRCRYRGLPLSACQPRLIVSLFPAHSPFPFFSRRRRMDFRKIGTLVGDTTGCSSLVQTDALQANIYTSLAWYVTAPSSTSRPRRERNAREEEREKSVETNGLPGGTTNCRYRRASILSEEPPLQHRHTIPLSTFNRAFTFITRL